MSICFVDEVKLDKGDFLNSAPSALDIITAMSSKCDRDMIVGAANYSVDSKQNGTTPKSWSNMTLTARSIKELVATDLCLQPSLDEADHLVEWNAAPKGALGLGAL